jgi:hypothetical protein
MYPFEFHSNQEDEMGGACIRNAYKVLVGKHEGKRALGRRRCRWEGNIRMDLR